MNCGLGCKIEAEENRKKHEDLIRAYNEKNRKLTQVQELYNNAKRASERGQLQQAASEALDNTVREADVLAVSQGFDKNSSIRDLGSLPPVPLFGVAHRGDTHSASMNTGPLRMGPMQTNNNSRWARQDDIGYRE